MISRQLGIMEKYHWVVHKIGYYRNVAVSVCYEFTKISTLDKEKIPQIIKLYIYAALLNTIRDIPMLSVCFLNDDGPDPRPRFHRLQSIDLDNVVNFADAVNTLQYLLEREHDTPFDTNDKSLPLWRLLVIHGPPMPDTEVIICFIFHHSIADGTSGKIFHSILSKHLNNIIPTQIRDVSNIVIPTSDKPLPVAMDTYKQIKAPIGYVLKIVIQQVLKSWPFRNLFFRKTFWTGDYPSRLPIDSRNVHTSMACMMIPSHDVEKLAHLCRKNQTTVTAALYVLSLMALFKIFHSADQTKMNFATSTPISIRPYIGIDKDAWGVYISAHWEMIQLKIPGYQKNDLNSEFNFWHACKNYKNRLSNGITDAMYCTSMLRYLGRSRKWESFFRNVPKDFKRTNGRSTSLELSNMGIWNIPSFKADNEWVPKSIQFSQSCSPVCGPSLSVVTMPGGPLSANLTYYSKNFKDAKVKMAQFQQEWEHLVSLLITDDKQLPLIELA